MTSARMGPSRRPTSTAATLPQVRACRCTVPLVPASHLQGAMWQALPNACSLNTSDMDTVPCCPAMRCLPIGLSPAQRLHHGNQ